MEKILRILLPLLLALAGAAGAGDAWAASGTEARLVFHSFDGGGPDYNAVLDTDIVSCRKTVRYLKANHAKLLGAGFDITFTFTGKKPGEARLRMQKRSPIEGNSEQLYNITVDSRLNVRIEPPADKSGALPAKPRPQLALRCGDRVLYADLEHNSSAQALVEKLSRGPVEIRMHDFGDFEKAGTLPWSLERNDEQITAQPGDVILYQGNTITIYYGTNSWSLTRLARIGSTDREKLLEFFGTRDPAVTMWVEWSE